MPLHVFVVCLYLLLRCSSLYECITFNQSVFLSLDFLFFSQFGALTNIAAVSIHVCTG